MKYLIIVFFLYTSVESFLDYSFLEPENVVERFTATVKSSGDAGDPLYLTQYIENGNIDEGRRLAGVPFTENFNIKSYAGLFTINKKYFSNQFFWYFPPLNNEMEAPVIIWLQGGPGISSLYGLFKENGPLRVINGEKLKKREFNWALNHHVIYVDNPVGTGFSFTNFTAGYCNNEVEVGDQLYSTLIQFFQLFPDLQSNDFFITGESYAGKYIPALAYTIHKRNPDAKLKINLKGLVMGNAWSDPIHQLVYGEYLYQLGLIDRNQMNVIETHKVHVENHIKNKNWDKAWLSRLDIMITIHNFTGLENLYNHQRTKKTSMDDYASILQSSDIRKGLHVGELPFLPKSDEVHKHLLLDIMQSVAPWISELLDHYDVFIYNGHLDIVVAYPLTVNYLQNLNFTGAEEYKTAKRNIWYVDEHVAGYVKTAGRLTEIMVKNAGHMVPHDRPKWAWDMITRITRGKGFMDE